MALLFGVCFFLYLLKLSAGSGLSYFVFSNFTAASFSNSVFGFWKPDQTLLVYDNYIT